jgi:tRNA(Ile2) C34 agmatinyltransferase TiaS
MVHVPPIEQVVEDWRIGMLATPPLTCPCCGKRTRAEYKCQWCKREWAESELELRTRERLALYSEYDYVTQSTLRHRGYYRASQSVRHTVGSW